MTYCQAKFGFDRIRSSKLVVFVANVVVVEVVETSEQAVNRGLVVELDVFGEAEYCVEFFLGDQLFEPF